MAVNTWPFAMTVPEKTPLALDALTLQEFDPLEIEVPLLGVMVLEELLPHFSAVSLSNSSWLFAVYTVPLADKRPVH